MIGWTDANVEVLRAGIRAGLSANEVARRIGTTKSAVISKAARLGVTFGSVATVPPRRVEDGPDRDVAGGGEPQQEGTPPPLDGVTFMDLRWYHCRRPLWADDATPSMEEQRYCGNKAVAGASWCAECAAHLGAGTIPKREMRGIEFVARKAS